MCFENIKKPYLSVILTTLLFCNKQNSISDAIVSNNPVGLANCNVVAEYNACIKLNGETTKCAQKYSCTVTPSNSSALIVQPSTPPATTKTPSCTQINNAAGIGVYYPEFKSCIDLSKVEPSDNPTDACWILGSSVAKYQVTTREDLVNVNSDFAKSNCPPLIFKHPTNKIPDIYKYQAGKNYDISSSNCLFDLDKNLVYLSTDVAQNIISPLRSMSQYYACDDSTFVEIIGDPVTHQPNQSSATIPNAVTPTTGLSSSNFKLTDDDGYLSMCAFYNKAGNTNLNTLICQKAFIMSGNSMTSEDLMATPDFKSCLDQCSKAK
jgi:hypothetical protein